MSAQAVREYLILIWKRYQGASRGLKSKLLDEIVKNTNLHRGSAKRLMSKKTEPRFGRGKGASINSYSDAAKRELTRLWRDMGYLGSRRMKGAIPKWINKWDSPIRKYRNQKKAKVK